MTKIEIVKGYSIYAAVFYASWGTYKNVKTIRQWMESMQAWKK